MAVRMKVCPNCDKEKRLVADFGYRHNKKHRDDIWNGPQRNYFQPWCSVCRNLPSAKKTKAQKILKKVKRNAAQKAPLPTKIQELRRLYKTKTGDMKLRSKDYMLKKLR